jgi:hypothetical protein
VPADGSFRNLIQKTDDNAPEPHQHEVGQRHRNHYESLVSPSRLVAALELPAIALRSQH